jgi:predicted ATPase
VDGFTLSRLTLSHFRSHRRTDLGFDGRPVAIYGPNGAGKTNILEAISLLSPAAAYAAPGLRTSLAGLKGLAGRLRRPLPHTRSRPSPKAQPRAVC